MQGRLQEKFPNEIKDLEQELQANRYKIRSKLST
jgi:hypothetical protein